MYAECTWSDVLVAMHVYLELCVGSHVSVLGVMCWQPWGCTLSVLVLVAMIVC